MDWQSYDAVLFDLDGVLTPTAEVHMRAWSKMFNEFLASWHGDQRPYTDEDYYAYVDGKPREDGVRAFLASREIDLPEGDGGDDPTAMTVHSLGNRKNEDLTAVLERDGVVAYPGSVRLLDALATTDLHLAVVSSSKNANAVLAAAGLSQRFEVVVDGAVAEREGLAGKPAPDTFLRAAQLLSVPRERCVVVEDAESGVAAGRAGGFGLVIGVDRGAGASSLRGRGAHLVVNDLAELLP